MKDNNFKIDGQLLYIEPTWITGDTCLFNIKNPITYAQAKTKLTQIRKKFISRLEEEGFIITCDKKDIDDDTICFIMSDTAISEENVDISIYKKEFDKRMFQAGGEKFNYPYSVTMNQYFENPFFPAVLKNELMNGGIDKFFIETPEQVEIIKRFYSDFLSDEEYSETLECCIFQQYIKTPTKYQTYMRVLMSSSGDVMGASLKYSKIEEKKREPQGILEKYFWNDGSKYFLNCNGMFNYYSDGGNISLPQPRYSSDKADILKAHGIDSSNPVIPDDVLEVASSIARKCNQELGIMCGIDFILNEEDNKWYYLEIQAFPAIEEWAVNKNIRIGKVNSVDDYLKYLTIELEARYDALMLHMHRKLSNNEKEKVKIKK